MLTTLKPLVELTAADLMSEELLMISHSMSLREAARVLAQAQISGAPVVDAGERLVGVLSATDFIRWAGQKTDRGHNQGVDTPRSPLPRTCSFQQRRWSESGGEAFFCTLPAGVCPMQGTHQDGSGRLGIICNEPHCVPTDWQVVEMENIPLDRVSDYMTTDVVTATPGTPICTLARMMLDARIHRVIVVDEVGRPVGIVSSTDVLAAVAQLDDGEGEWTPTKPR